MKKMIRQDNCKEYTEKHSEGCVYAQRSVTYPIMCFERDLIVAYVGDVLEDEIYSILDERYDTWIFGEEDDEFDADTIGDFCCEEYLLMGLEKLPIKFIPIYVDVEHDDFI